MASFHTSVVQSERLFPNTRHESERTVALSLMDATAFEFTPTCVSWLCEPPEAMARKTFNLADHLRQSLRVTLDVYPQLCGRVHAVTSLDGTGPCTAGLAPHARRFGRLHVHYGTSQDPGAEFIIADSTATLDVLCPASRETKLPRWNRNENPLNQFVPSTPLCNAMKPDTTKDGGIFAPSLAIQLTNLACGGFVLTVNCLHTLVDVHSLVHFVKDWANVSRSLFSNMPLPSLKPLFEPELLDSLAAGDINSDTPDPAIIDRAMGLPLNRYDWWLPSVDPPVPGRVPEPFAGKEHTPAGKVPPWSEWPMQDPVSHYVVYFSPRQIEIIWKWAMNGSQQGDGVHRISQHDALLAHVWSCINRARKLERDSQPVHCNLSLGIRPTLQLSQSFIGSPVFMINVELPAKDLTVISKTDEDDEAIPLIQPVARRIRQTISEVNQPAALAAHLYSIAYETSPQRIWQGFLGQRHIVATAWTRVGLYDVDFGLASSPSIRFAEGIIQDLDGIIVIKEAPRTKNGKQSVESMSPSSWTEDGADVSLRLRAEDMDRLLQDPFLFPSQSS